MPSGVALAAIVIAMGRTAHAADIGLVANDPKDPFVTRLALELEQLGFTVTRGAAVASSRDVAVLELRDDAAVDLHGARSNDEISRPVRRLVATGDALKVAEEVHALMLPLVARPPAPTGPEPPAAPASDRDRPPASATEPSPPPPPPPLDLAVSAGALVGTSRPGLGIAASVAFYPRALRARPWSLGVGLFGIYAAIPENVASSSGSADVRALVGGAEMIARLAIAEPFTVDAGLGVAVAHVQFDGQSNAPFTSREESTTVASPAARLRAQYTFTRALGVFAELRGGVAVPSVSVRFAGESVADWGGPWAHVGGGAALAF